MLRVRLVTLLYADDVYLGLDGLFLYKKEEEIKVEIEWKYKYYALANQNKK